jgi:hypothetical protein
VAGNYLENRSDPPVDFPFDRRRPATICGGAGGAKLVVVWASKPSKPSVLSWPETSPVTVALFSRFLNLSL